MTDLFLVETGNGGDLLLKGNDLAKINSFENMVYLALFGGNVRQSTVKNTAIPQSNNTNAAPVQNFDFWANSLLLSGSQQFNSQTERVLKDTPLSSAGRSVIQNAVNADVAFMTAFAKITVTVSIIATNVVQLNIVLIEPENLQQTEFIFIWDGLKMDFTGPNAPVYVPNPSPVTEISLQETLQILL